MKIFISYSRHDNLIADFITDQLQCRGANVFIDSERLNGGDDFIKRLSEEIIASDFMLLLLSPRSEKSKWVRKETNFAFENDITIIPIIIETTDMKSLMILSGLERIDLRDWNHDEEKTDEAISKLTRSINLPLNCIEESEPQETLKPIGVFTPYEPKQPIPEPPSPNPLTKLLSNKKLIKGGVSALVLTFIGIAIATLMLYQRGIPGDLSGTTPGESSEEVPGEAFAGAALPRDISTPTPTPTPTATPLPIFNMVQKNADWKEIIEEDFGDNISMVYVPGCFGSGEECVMKSPFWIDKYEVSNSQFNTMQLAYKLNFDVGSEGCNPSTGIDNPHTCINWEEATIYCRVRGGRLPTSTEWSWAAVGPDQLLYPWGETLVSAYAIHSTNSNGKPADTNTKIGGESWVGAHHMAGNIGEWTSTEDGDQRIYRGGSYSTFPAQLASSIIVGLNPNDSEPQIGFRCVRNYSEGDLD